MATKKSKAGSLIWRKGGWSGRYRAIVDGESVRVCVPLGTDNKSAARIKLERLMRGGSPESVAEVETFEEAARRIVPEQGIKSESVRARRLETYAFPELGSTPVDKLRAADIRHALEAMAQQGLSQQSVKHLLADISGVLGTLWRDEVLPENAAKRVQVPKFAKVDGRPRVVLSDDEFSRLVAWPDLHAELRVMCLVARCVGGMRTSDLHAWSWEHIDWIKGDAHVPRPKTKTSDRLVLPAQVMPALRGWWKSSGSPVKGPVFPEAWGPNAGERRGRKSHAGRLRRALWTAGVRRGETKETCPLQTDTADTKRVDFHSFRRAYNTGLATAGVNVQTAMALAGHRQASTHMRYVRLTEVLEVPLAALPRAALVPRVGTMLQPTPRNRSENGGALIRSSCRLSRANQSQSQGFLGLGALGDTPFEPLRAQPGHRKDALPADRALLAYLRNRANQHADELLADHIENRGWHASHKASRVELIKQTDAAGWKRAKERAWRQENPEKRRDQGHRRRALKVGGQSECLSRDEIRAVLESCDGRCAYCFELSDSLTIDHIVPLARGGGHVLANLAPACARCNSSKHTKSLSEWLGVRVFADELSREVAS